MIIGVPREAAAGELRIAVVPDTVKKLAEQDVEVWVEAAGSSVTHFPDEAYEAAGARMVTETRELWQRADVVVKVQPPSDAEIDMLREGAWLIAALYPYTHPEVIARLAERGVTSFALDLMPRITVAQDKDILSSMSTISGYKAVLIAANALPVLMPMMMTAAGTLKPARVLVLGVGVAGLQAIATARRLGAVVEAFDIRPVVKEQVESLGARFVAQEAVEEGSEDKGGYAKELTAEQQARQREILSQHIADSNVVICSALVPGRRAPVLLSRSQVDAMKPGSVVVDLAAESGGNCELTRPGEIVDHGGVKIHGPLNVPSMIPVHASQMFSRNVQNYLLHLIDDGKLELDMDSELTTGPLVTRDGKIVHDAVRAALEK